MATPKIPNSTPDDEVTRVDAYEALEQPTVKRQNPLSDPPLVEHHTTQKMKKAEIEALVKSAKDASGTHPAISTDEIQRFERHQRAKKARSKP